VAIPTVFTLLPVMRRMVGIAAVGLLAVMVGTWAGHSHASGRTVSSPRIAFFSHGNLVVVDLATGARRTVLAEAPVEAIAWSVDGRLLSDGGRIIGGPRLAASSLTWAPTGETAAYETKSGAVELWSRGVGSRMILAAAWGATSFAWGPSGELAVGRSRGSHHDVWLWKSGKLARVATATGSDPRPIVAALDGRGRVLWWDDPFSSASVAADGLSLYANGTRLAQTLVFPDYIARCGSKLAVSAANDRYTTDGKRILLDGRDVSRDSALSWVSPSCNASGLLVAAAGPNLGQPRIGHDEHRAIWELEPRRVQLSHPPARWTDENPRVLPDGSILFVRTRETSVKAVEGYRTTDTGRIERIAAGHTTHVATTSCHLSPPPSR
jgi:hypothetical protein